MYHVPPPPPPVYSIDIENVIFSLENDMIQYLLHSVLFNVTYLTKCITFTLIDHYSD